MAIPTDTGAVSGSPFAKFRHLGDNLTGAFASDSSKSRRQMRKFQTDTLLYKDDGKTPRLEEIMHFVAMPATTAFFGSDDPLSPIEEAMHVRFAVSGFKWGQVIDARKTLPAHAGFGAGVSCSGDVYSITLAGWSAETANAPAAMKAGFTVVDGRIVLTSQEDKDRYVLAQSNSGGNTNPAKDYEITLRRPTADEKRWEQLADELYLTKPWETTAAEPAMAGADPGGYAPAPTEEPF